MKRYQKQKMHGVLVIAMLISLTMLALPSSVFAAGRGVGGGSRIGGGSRSFGHAGFSRAQGRSHGFDRRGFFGRGFLGDGFFDGGDVTIEQSVPTPVMEAPRPVDKGRYVPPRWVDGGYGVEVLQPGYWTGPEKETRR